MKLLNNVPTKLATVGDHLVTVRLNGGTAKLQYSVASDIAMSDLSTYATDTDEIKTLCACSLNAVLTGDATIHINLATR